MATGFSENELNFARKKFYGRFHTINENISFFQKLINYALINFYLIRFSILNLKRAIFRSINTFYFSRKKQQENIEFNINLDKERISQSSEELKMSDFTYIENFLTNECYQSLINYWPNINHFNHLKKITKHYNVGFKYDSKNSTIDETFKAYTSNYALKQFYSFLISERFKKFYDKLINIKDDNFHVGSILSTMASNNSYLIPHYDGVSHNSNFKKGYNFIYFIDGYEKDLIPQGATGIYQDSEFKLPILIPRTIKNSLLIYNTNSTNFYHGFKNIVCPKNIYRKTINFHIILNK